MLNPDVRKREILGWALYDFANSSYTTVVITAFYSSFFVAHIVPSDSKNPNSYWSLAIILGTLVALFLSPLIGAMCDFRGKKKPYLIAATVVCSLATMGLALAGPGDIAIATVFIVISSVAFMISESFCGSFLPELATKDGIGKLSGIGWGVGYFGGLASVITASALIGSSESQEIAQIIRGNQNAMLATGLFFLIAAIPSMAFLKDRGKPTKGFETASAMKLFQAGLKEMRHTAEIARKNPELLRFFVAFTVYMAGLDAVIKFFGIYADQEVGLTSAQRTQMFLTIQLSAAAGALAFGFLESKIGAKKTVLATIIQWIVCTLAIIYVKTVSEVIGINPQTTFLGIALLAGTGIGSIQSSSRAVVGILAPREHAAEIFGFWGMFMRIATILGMSYGFIADQMGDRRLSLFLLIGFFGIGGILLQRVKFQKVEP